VKASGVFHIVFVVFFFSVVVLRLYYHYKARTWKRRNRAHEGPVIPALRILVGVPMMAAVLVYPFKPAVLSFATFSLSPKWRWTGATLTLISVILLGWVHRSLGRNFSTELRIQEDHRLVTNGPYRYVRHPMYPTFLLMFAGFLLLTANWLVGGPGLVFIIAVMIFRTPREETMLGQVFGDQYSHYTQRTGRYLPRLR
jgi:protein-S-isoprenylcysteine O-methyltransferase Ste14